MNGVKIRAVYVFLYMAFAIWRVFYNLYLEENDFTGVQIGIINALIQATVFVIVPLWGVFADKQGIRPTFRLAVFMSGILLLFLGNILNFYTLIIYILVLTFFHHPLGPLIDALAVQFSQKSKESNYGNLRLWGSFGWAISSISCGYLFLHFDLKLMFPLSSALFFITLFSLGVPWKKELVKYTPHFERIKFSEIANNRPLLFFLVILFLYGIASSPINAYINLYFADLGADNSTIGIAYTIQSLSELPFFIIGNRLLKHLGAMKILLISMIIMIVRYFIYSIFPGVTLALICSALQGITLSFFLVGAVDYLHKHMPPSRHATVQSLLWGLYFGLGHTIGNFIIGLLKDQAGMIGVMKVFLFVTIFTFILTATGFQRKILQKEIE